MSIESMCIIKCFLRLKKVMVDCDLMHAWELRSSRFLAPPYSRIMNFTSPWYIWPSGPWSFNVCVSCSLSAMVYWIGGRGFDSKCFSRELGEYVSGTHREVAY